MNTEQRIHELAQAMKAAKDRRHFERYQAVYLYLTGYLMKEIGHIIGRRHETVGRYISAYKESGLDGLTLGHSPGRSKRLTDTQEQALVDTITTKIPADVGFPARANWTLKIIVHYVEKEWGHIYSLRGMSILLKRLGLSFTRPTYTLEKADPEQQRIFTAETFPALKKSSKMK